MASSLDSRPTSTLDDSEASEPELEEIESEVEDEATSSSRAEHESARTDASRTDSDSSTVVSLLDKLRSPRASDLARKRQLKQNHLEFLRTW